MIVITFISTALLMFVVGWVLGSYCGYHAALDREKQKVEQNNTISELNS